MAKACIIAEIGSCHDGEIEKAKFLIRAAREAGADAVKAQFWSSPDRLADRRRVPAYYREIYRRYRMPAPWLPILKAEAEAGKIEFMVTAYLPEDIATVAPFVQRFKVASFESRDAQFLRAHASFKKPVLISTGMRTHGEIVTGAGVLDATLLHCVSAYPAPISALNLACCRRGYGFSDHSLPELTWTGALAVAAGAQVIEAHLKLDSTDPKNPDAPHAMTPQQFTEYVRHIRFAEQCLGDGVKKFEACEAAMAEYAVRS